MSNFIEFDFMGEKQKCNLLVDSYLADGSLAILLVDKDGEPWCDLTKCLASPFSGADETHAYLDTNSYTNLKEIVKKYNLGKYTEQNISQGFCVYPLYEFNMEEVNKYRI